MTEELGKAQQQVAGLTQNVLELSEKLQTLWAQKQEVDRERNALISTNGTLESQLLESNKEKELVTSRVQELETQYSAQGV